MRFRLTLLFGGALALILAIGGIVAYVTAYRMLRAETDSFLAIETHRVERVLTSDGNREPAAVELSEAMATFHRPPASTRRAPGLLWFDTVYVRVVEPGTGREIAVSDNLAQDPPRLRSLDSALVNIERRRIAFKFAGPNEEQIMRIATLNVPVGHRLDTVQVAVPWDPTTDVLNKLALVLISGILLLVVFTVAGGWLMVGHTLRPIQRIATEAENLDANNLTGAMLPAQEETDSEVGQMVSTLNDMTARLHLAFQAQRRFSDAQQRFAADASHELRTPLTILRGEMDLALSRPRDTDAYRTVLESAVEEIDAMSRIVESLSFLARMDSGYIRTELPKTTVDLSLVCEGIAGELQTRGEASHVSLILATTPAYVHGNEDQLRQLVRNLVGNALKYTPAGGKVTVGVATQRSESGDDEVVVTVEDTGVGIEADDLPHIFERFWRADRARTSPGTGLGLAICARIVEAHDGRITAESQVGRGSTFRVSLPAGPVHP